MVVLQLYFIAVAAGAWLGMLDVLFWETGGKYGS